MSNVVLAVAKSPFTIFPCFAPEDARQGDEESIRVKMLFDFLSPVKSAERVAQIKNRASSV